MMESGAAQIDLQHPLLATIGGIADSLGIRAWVVGGYVRDLLLGRTDSDIDVIVVGDGIAFARAVARETGAGPVVAFERFGTAMLPTAGGKVEFVGARRERYDPSSRNPAVAPATLEEDLHRRDFTVNAIAAGLNRDSFGRLEDPLAGREDIVRRLLRTPLDPARTFDDDPLRMMRAARFAAQLKFTIDPPARAAIARMADRVSIVAPERITGEFMKILGTTEPSVGILLMFDTGLLQHVFPEIARMAGVDQRRDHHHKDVFLHTCTVVDNVARASGNIWLRFAALVHDIAKPRTKAFREGTGWTFHGHEELGARMMKKIFQRMKLPFEHLPYVEKLIRLHLRPMALVDDGVTDSAVRRLVFEAGNDIDDLMILCRADITSKNPALVARYSGNYENVLRKIAEVEERDRLRNWQPPVRGEEIMSVCGIGEGRSVGRLKKAIEEAILDGRIPNEHDAALAYLLSIKDGILAE
ncbi:MAG TPA: CCA tRNA nucleotidyltransferase [Bacteroidota bacterium]|nr:CCA tRNA nucleotidyltransferase [Bacteroidota bacterium]